MTGKRGLTRVTSSLDSDDYTAIGKLAQRIEVSASWLTRPAIRDFLDRFGERRDPELALRLADTKRVKGDPR